MKKINSESSPCNLVVISRQSSLDSPRLTQPSRKLLSLHRTTILVLLLRNFHNISSFYLLIQIKKINFSNGFFCFIKLFHLLIFSCPTNIGTGLRASIHVKLPLLSKDMVTFEKIAADNHVQIRGIHGEHSESEGGIFDVSNKRRIGFSEVQLVHDMFNGVKGNLFLDFFQYFSRLTF